MRYFWQLVWMFIPREGGDEAAAAAAAAAEAEAAKAPLGGDDPDKKPDWAADKFWNPDLKQVRSEPLHKAYNELEGKMRGKEDDLRATIQAEMSANAPDEYTVNLSDDLKIPDNVELDFSPEDPLVSWFFGFAKENGMSQDVVDKALNEYVGIELGNMTDVAAEIVKLGDHGQDRMLRVHNWMEAKLSDEQMAAMGPQLQNAAQIEALEVLMKSSGPADFEGDSGGPALSLEELREMQNDKRAWQEKNPAFLKKIEEGYARLYKGQ